MNDILKRALMLPVKSPIEYWDKYWGCFAEKLGEKDNYKVMLDSPRFLIDTIISEIEYNNLKNKDNSNLFKDQLSEWNKKDIVFRELFQNKVVLLLQIQQWDENSGRYILSICKEINIKLNSGIYFDNLLKHLINIISKAKSLDYSTKKEINKYTELIFSEFIANDFAIDDIKSLSHDVEGVLLYESGAVIVAPEAYKGLKRTDYENDESYHKSIENYIENRTVEERISILRDNYYIEPKDCFVLFRLIGIKGDVDYIIDDINIYAPHLKQYIKENSSLSKIEQVTSERKYVNAAIPVKHKMLHSSVAYAKQKLERIIDLLTLSYNISEPIKWDSKDVSVIENGVFKCGLDLSVIDENILSEHKKFLTYMDFFDISDIENDLTKISERFTAINKNKTSDTLKLATAAHWHQKGKYIQNPEDKLLFHWIAVESLLKTEAVIRCNITGRKDANLLQTVQKTAASIIVERFFHNYCYNMYIDINYQTQFGGNYLYIPDDIIRKASLNMKDGDRVCISKFFHHINDVENSINDEILKTELHEIDSFYRGESGVKKKEQEIYNDIALIYRLRNLIAHNAVCPRYLIDLYANKAQYISGSIIRFLIEKYRIKNVGIEELLITISSQYDEFKLNINNEIKKLKS